VIKSYADYNQYLYKKQSSENDPKIFFGELSKVLYCMRKDLGLSNKGLGKNGVLLLRGKITDFDEIMGYK
jgi:hypothetical protein